MTDRLLTNLMRDLNGREPYALLGVPRTASKEAIERAYRTRRRELHPDRADETNKAIAEDMTKLVGIAFAVLGNADRRVEYDALTATSQQPTGQNTQRRQSTAPDAKPDRQGSNPAQQGSRSDNPSGSQTENRSAPASWRVGQAGTGPGPDVHVDCENESVDDVINNGLKYPFEDWRQPGKTNDHQSRRYPPNPTSCYPNPYPHPTAPPYDQHRAYSPGWSGKAIAALVLALLIPPVGAIIAIPALLDIRSSDRRGTGLAIAALVIGGLATIGYVGQI